MLHLIQIKWRILFIAVCFTCIFFASFYIVKAAYTPPTVNSPLVYDTKLELYDDVYVEGGPLYYMVPSSEPNIFIILGCGKDVTYIKIPETIKHSYKGEDSYVYFKEIGNGAFSNLEKLGTVNVVNFSDFFNSTLKTGSFSNCAPLDNDGYGHGIDLANSHIEIFEDRCITNCPIRLLQMPEETKYISPTAFVGCYNLKRIQLENKKYIGIDGHIFSNDKQHSIMYMYGPYDPQRSYSNTSLKASNSVISYTIPDGVTTIGEKCFYDCGLANVIVSEGVKTICDNAFTDSNIKSLVLPDSIESIADNAIPTGATVYCNTNSYVASQLESKQDIEILPAEYFNTASYKYDPELHVPLNKIEMSYGDKSTVNCCSSAKTPIKYFSSNSDVASVDSNGLISINSAGKATITVQATSDDMYKETTQLIDVVIHKANQKIVGSTWKYDKKFGSKPFRLSQKAKTKLSYTSSNKKIASVNEKGVISIINPGKATIKIRAKGTNNYNSKTAYVTVISSLAKPILKTYPGKSSIKIRWEKVSGATGYRIYVCNSDSGKFKFRISKPSNIRGITHKGLIKGKKYRYKIRAFRKSNGKTYYSQYSKTITARAK